MKDIWAGRAEGRPMIRFANKLKAVKKGLQTWNMQIFGKVDQRVRSPKDKVLQMEILFESDPLEENKINICKAKIELNTRLQLKQFWRQKENLKWVKEGDKNTKKFHHSVSQRMQKLLIQQIRDNQRHMLEGQGEIRRAAVSYFQDQLSWGLCITWE